MQKDANNRKHERKDTRKASHVSAELCLVRKPPFWFWTQRHREANIATCYANLSKYADAPPYYTKAFELMPDRITSSNINREYGFALVGAGQREKAREVFGLGLTKPDLRAAALRSLGLLDLYEGRYNDASARLKEAIEASQAEKNDIGVARTGRGKTADALIELDQVEKLDAAFVQAPWLAARLGVAFARVGSPDRAARVPEKIRAKISPTDHETESAANDLEGEIEMARGNFPRAIELLQKSRLDTYPPSIPLSLVGQARAYARCGCTWR
jgi:tetratricopeptide (TPR) repeat protein